MIICQCNVIAAKDIEAAVERLLSPDPHRVVTPGLVFRSLGKTGKCCGCFPAVIDAITHCQKQLHSQLSGTMLTITVEKELS